MNSQSHADRVLSVLDQALRTLFAPARSARPSPAAELPQDPLPGPDRRRSAALMRVNHSGEIAAQALYEGQSLVARDETLRTLLRQAAREEADHLAWTQARIAELGGRKSILNPLWYGGGLAMGIAFGLLGDRWNLGFLAETERQVETHLESHLKILPASDSKSRAVIEQMQRDEAAHAIAARRSGGEDLPAPVRLAMRCAGRVLTGLSRLG
ncbi:MAG: 2-polyprenyl-3-methyl-6-methoxy-1,4-benzoquinone monooxygenase [Betaproteobacteria bacterium]|nr:2-polyprenyl-3-methyl-6-methoxy-1,4-benzoquinone monooxygenase [Betaproteobacteria bacterium]